MEITEGLADPFSIDLADQHIKHLSALKFHQYLYASLNRIKKKLRLVDKKAVMAIGLATYNEYTMVVNGS